MSFLKYTLATIVGLILFSILSIFVLIGIGSAASQKEEVKIKDTSVLELNLGLPIVEKEEENPFADLGFDVPGAEAQLGLKEIKECIRNAAKDERIKAIYLNTSNFGGGFAMAKEIRDELIQFKGSGKPVIAYSDYYSESAYYLAAVADDVLLHPMGFVEFNGFNFEMMFFGGTLEKLDIEAEVIRVGEYKSAAESLVLKEMSEENREQITFLLDDIYSEYIKDIANARSTPDSTLRQIADEHRIRLAEDAIQAGLADKLVNHDEAIDILKQSINADSLKVEMVAYGKYKKVNLKDENSSKNRVAVLVAEGEIRMGESEDGVLGAETFAKEMKKLREDEKVKAIVMRVNSPGGSAVASEVMAREIALTREVKPVVSSMGDVAASGGYWISMGCDKIVAQPNTITGSIGVIGVIFNLENFMKNKLGITFDKVKTGKYADIANGSHKMTEEEKAIIQVGVDDIYEEFTSNVSKHRNIPIEEVKAMAGGRVWTGNQALERKLIDEVGDFERAVEIAVELAELEDYKLRYYPPKENFFEKIMNDAGKDEFVAWIMGEPDEFIQMANKLRKIKEQEGIMARLPYGLEINY